MSCSWLRGTRVVRSGFSRLGCGMGWDDIAGSGHCFLTSQASQSSLHVACISWLQALAFPQHGQSPVHLPSVPGGAGGTETKDSKIRGCTSVALVGDTQSTGEEEDISEKGRGSESPQGDASCGAGACRVLGMLVPAAGRGSGSGHQQEGSEFDQESNRMGDQIWRGGSWECISASRPSLNAGAPALPSFIHRSGSVPGT